MKATKDDIVARSFPKIRPENGTALYFQSKAETKKFKKVPEWDCARDSVYMSLYQARSSLYMSNQRLTEKRKLSVQKRLVFNKQWDELKQKERALSESFQKFSNFVQENQEKRERAEKRIVEERRNQEKRLNDSNVLQKDIEYLMMIKQKMDYQIKEYRMFEEYLETAAKSSQIFKNPIDIITRYEALVDAKQLLFETQQKVMTDLDTAKSDMSKMLEEKSLVIVGLRNNLADLQGRYDMAKSNSLTMETLLVRVQEVTSQRMAEISVVRKSCYNLYRTICSRLRVQPTLHSNAFEQQLLFIKKTLFDLMNVYNAAKVLCGKECNSMDVEASPGKELP